MRIGAQGAWGGQPSADADHGAPLGEARAHRGVLDQALAQTIESLGDVLAGKARERLGAGIDLDSRDDAGVLQRHGERQTCIRLLANRLVVQDRAADALAEPRRRHDHVAVGAARLGALGDAERREAPVARSGALVHREQAAIALHQGACGVGEGLCVHIRLLSSSVRRSPGRPPPALPEGCAAGALHSGSFRHRPCRCPRCPTVSPRTSRWRRSP